MEVARREDGLQRGRAKEAVVTTVISRIGKVLDSGFGGRTCDCIGPGRQVARISSRGEQHAGLAHDKIRVRLEKRQVARDERLGPQVIRCRPHEVGRLGCEKHVAEIQCGPEIVRLAIVGNPRILGSIRAADGFCVIHRAVVRYDQYEVTMRLGEQAVECSLQQCPAVVHGHADRHFCQGVDPFSIAPTPQTPRLFRPGEMFVASKPCPSARTKGYVSMRHHRHRVS